MAAPIDLTSATTAEGQLAMLLEGLVNLQGNTTISNTDNVTMITSNVINDITGIQSVSLTIPISSTGSANGFALVADEIFYPKV
jgi:hypothetical protein